MDRKCGKVDGENRRVGRRGGKRKRKSLISKRCRKGVQPHEIHNFFVGV